MVRLIQKLVIFLLPIVLDAVIRALHEYRYEQRKERYRIENDQH